MNPNLILKSAIAGQTITDTKVIVISTDFDPSAPGIVNVPFITKNANAVKMTAIFWVETITAPNGDAFLQLQYTQRVLLDFNDLLWPHISVATLIQQ